MAQVQLIGYTLTTQTFKSGKTNNVLSLIARKQDKTEYVFNRIVFVKPNWLVKSYMNRLECIQ